MGQESWVERGSSILETVTSSRIVSPPYGYITAVGMWAVYLVGMYGGEILIQYLGGPENVYIETASSCCWYRARREFCEIPAAPAISSCGMTSPERTAAV